MTQREAFVVTGGAGFLGSHLVEALIRQGAFVYVVDDLSTGKRENIVPLLGDCTLIEEDIASRPHVRWMSLVETSLRRNSFNLVGVFHLASPASPPAYQARPLDTLRVNSLGTDRALWLAHVHGARFIMASTSEVYGDPAVHPQTEDYFGNVDPAGPRSMYDEGKRYAEALCAAYVKEYGTDVGIARIFNTYGPRMGPDDGRIIPTFLRQALDGEKLTIHGEGRQTRSLCYVDDTVRGLLALYRAGAGVFGPVNIGNPVEMEVLDIGLAILRAAEGVNSTFGFDRFEFVPRPAQDPTRREPDVSLAERVLDWRPVVTLADGLYRTVRAERERRGEYQTVRAGDPVSELTDFPAVVNPSALH